MARFLLLSAILPIVVSSGGLASAQESAPGLLRELKLGALAHDIGGLWIASNREEGVDINFEASLGPSLDLGFATLRPAIGASINVEGDTSKLYVGARIERDFASGVFLAAGVGAAIHDGKLGPGHQERKALGSRGCHPWSPDRYRQSWTMAARRRWLVTSRA